MTASIVISEGQGYVSGLSPEAVEAVTKATSFRPVGFQYTIAFQKGRTDGSIKLFRHSKFPAGLVDRVTMTLANMHEPYTIEIEQKPDDKPDLPPYELIDIESRWYQDDAVEVALLNPRGIIRSPTGSGKTAIGARVIIARNKHALVIVPTLDLLHQYREFLEAHILDNDTSEDPTGGSGWGRCHIGQLGDGVVDPQPITVATVKTYSKAVGVAYNKYEFGEYDDSERDTDVSPSKMREWIGRIGTLVVDEAHILGAQSVFDCATKTPCLNKYGFSASPWRDDGADLMIEAATGGVIFTIPTKILVDEGYLVPPIIETFSTKGYWQPAAWGQTCAKCKQQRPPWPNNKTCPNCLGTRWRSEFGDAYKHEIVENPIRNQLVADRTNALSEPTLVLVKQVKHGKLLEPLIHQSRFLSGKDAGVERSKAYEDIRQGKLRVLIATTIADLGLDVPALVNLVLAGGGKSSTRHLQRIGRVARPYPGKTHARVIDFDDSHVHKWFKDHEKARRKIEKAEWGSSGIWI